MDDGSRGFPAKDALNEHYSHLRNRDDTWVLGQCSSVSIRIEVVSVLLVKCLFIDLVSDDRLSLLESSGKLILFICPYTDLVVLQIKTITYHKPPRSIDLAKLCTEVARSLKLFIKVLVSCPYFNLPS
jgi:hypothetical protein